MWLAEIEPPPGGVDPMALVPSPNARVYERTSPFASDAVAENVTGCPGMADVGAAENVPNVGGAFTLAVSLATNPSVELNRVVPPPVVCNAAGVTGKFM